MSAVSQYTLYLSLENSPQHVVRPRFDVLRGNCDRFHLLNGIASALGETRPRGNITLKDLDVLCKAINETRAGLLIVDPIQSYLGADVDAHRSNETRPLLDGLARLADEQRCCILLVRHLSKSSGGRAIHRGLGSIDLTGAVRSELLAGNEADDPNNRALVHVKSNLGRFGDSLGFTIDESGFAWTGKSALNSSDLLAPDGDAETRSEIHDAVDYLSGELLSGERLQQELLRGGNFTERTLQRAAKKLRVQRKRQGPRGPVLWSLPDSETPTRQ